MKTRYAVLTVDTEALPNRAEMDHVNRLILGRHGCHEAGVRDMARIGAEFGISLIFFIDICGAYSRLDELREIASWLHTHGQDVQLHAHPEYLPYTFWRSHRKNKRPWYMNEYTQERSDFVLTHFARILESFTGRAPIAFRAGSFRWNASTLLAMEKNGIKLSFNNSMCAVMNQQCPFSLPTNAPYMWSNGIIEIPVSERHILPFINDSWWARLQYPQSKYFRYRGGKLDYAIGGVSPSQDVMVFLLHSWSFLHRDKQGYEIYLNDRLLEDYRNFLKKLSLECEVITSNDLLELVEQGKIPISHIQDVNSAAYIPSKDK